MILIEPICLFWLFYYCILRYWLAVIVYFYLFALYWILWHYHQHCQSQQLHGFNPWLQLRRFSPRWLPAMQLFKDKTPNPWWSLPSAFSHWLTCSSWVITLITTLFLADLRRFSHPFLETRHRVGPLGPFPRGEEAAVVEELLCSSLPSQGVCLASGSHWSPWVSPGVWGTAFPFPLSVPPLLPGRGFL